VRRSRLRTAVGSLLLGALLSLGSGACNGGEDRPDVILVVWDTTRADRLSAFGHDRPTTPRLEELAARGVRYPRTFTPAPWTAPAHASLFTGLAVHRHGLEVGRGDRMHHGIPTLAQTLKAAGYHTACFTANAYISQTTGLSAGFTDFIPVYDRKERDSARVKSNDAEGVRIAVAEWLAKRGRKKAGDPPLFLFLNMMDCHQPHRPLPVDVLAVKDGSVSPEDLGKASSLVQPDFLQHLMGTKVFDEGTLRGLAARYDACARLQDRKTGEILDLLEEAGIARDALVLVTADHGEGLGEHGMVEHRLSCYEAVLHVPLVVRWPGRFEGGKSVDRAVSLMDVYPTILEAAGAAVPEGNGLDAVLLPREPVTAGGRTLLARFPRPLAHIEEMRKFFPTAPESSYRLLSVSITSVREPVDAKRPLKYLRWEKWDEEGNPAGLAREELYDWVADPGEERNLLEVGDAADRAAADLLAGSIGALEKRTLR
jgi:arylsulfatase A-like enzyme